MEDVDADANDGARGAAAAPAHDSAVQGAGELAEPFVGANGRLAVPNHDRDLQAPVLGRRAPRDAATDRAEVPRVAHAPANRVDQDVQLRLGDLSRHLNLELDARRGTGPDRR